MYSQKNVSKRTAPADYQVSPSNEASPAPKRTKIGLDFYFAGATYLQPQPPVQPLSAAPEPSRPSYRGPYQVRSIHFPAQFATLLIELQKAGTIRSIADKPDCYLIRQKDIKAFYAAAQKRGICKNTLKNCRASLVRQIVIHGGHLEKAADSPAWELRFPSIQAKSGAPPMKLPEPLFIDTDTQELEERMPRASVANPVNEEEQELLRALEEYYSSLP